MGFYTQSIEFQKDNQINYKTLLHVRTSEKHNLFKEKFIGLKLLLYNRAYTKDLSIILLQLIQLYGMFIVSNGTKVTLYAANGSVLITFNVIVK